MEKDIKEIENLNKPALVIDYAHRIIFANSILSSLLKKPLNEIIGEYCYNAITCDLCFKDCPFLSVFEHNSSFEKKGVNYYEETGETKLIDYSIAPYEFDNTRGALITIAPSGEEEKIKEIAPDKNKENQFFDFYESAMNMLDEGVVFVDKDFKIFKCNTSLENLTGYSKLDLIGQPCPKICHVPEGYTCPFDYCYKNNKYHDEVFSVISRKDLSPILVKANLKILKNSFGELLGGIAVIKKILDFEKLKKEYPLDDIITESELMKEAVSLLGIAGFSKKHFIITGETGTGKKFLAEKLKLFYPENNIPFYTLNTKGLTSDQIEKELFGFEKNSFLNALDTKIGLLEKANNGILVIDDICDLSINIQKKLYDVLITKKLNRLGSDKSIDIYFQLVALTSKDIKYLLEKNLFHRELYELISTITIKIPPLRERKKDFIPLIEFFLKECKTKGKEKNLTTISQPALNIFLEYPWEGNVQELKNVVEHIYFVSTSTKKEINIDMIPESIRETVTKNLKYKSVQQEREKIIKVLRETDLDRNEAAKILGYSRITLWRKIKQYNITIDELLKYFS